MCRLPFHLRWKIFGVAMIMYLLLFASQLVCNEVYTEDGMVSRFFGITKHYAWEDVVSYRITDNFDDTLMVRVKMEDGRSYTLMGGLVCVWMTLEPEESDTDSVEYITRMALERIHRNGVRSEVNWEKVHKECMEYWSDYAGELQQILGE